jgi:hypothetical protein
MVDFLESVLGVEAVAEMDRENRQLDTFLYRRKEAEEKREAARRLFDQECRKRARILAQQQRQQALQKDWVQKDELLDAVAALDAQAVTHRDALDELCDEQNSVNDMIADEFNKLYKRVNEQAEEIKSLQNALAGLRAEQSLVDRRMVVARAEAILSRGEIRTMRQNWHASGASRLSLVKKQNAA